jgi:hypothetical protein
VGKGPAFGEIFEERMSPIDIPRIESQISQLSSVIATLKEKPAFEKLVLEISPIPDMLHDQLKRVLADASFEHLPDGRIQWNREQDVLKASRMPARPALDGDFSKWQSGPIYDLNQTGQIEDGERLWKGPVQFSARVALRCAGTRRISISESMSPIRNSTSRFGEGKSRTETLSASFSTQSHPEVSGTAGRPGLITYT